MKQKIYVQKYGGTSLASCEQIKAVAHKIKAFQARLGCKIVVVVSAMGDTTDNLVELAQEVASIPKGKAMDLLLASGEQVSAALMTLALTEIKVQTSVLLGTELPIITDSVHQKARILHVVADKINAALLDNDVLIIAGFQGITAKGNITTLGRGGSDVTAVAICAALKACECQIYTDVEGIFTVDPRLVPYAKLFTSITFERMLELASLGAKVLQMRAVEFAGNHDVPLRVLSTFSDGPGTLISYEENTMEDRVVSGIAYTCDVARIAMYSVDNIVGCAANILSLLGDASIEVDMIVQSIDNNGRFDFAFTVPRADIAQTKVIIESLAHKLNAKSIIYDIAVAKLSLVGVGLRSRTLIVSKMLSVLAKQNINLQAIASSEIKVSVILDEKDIALGVRTLAEAFDLSEEN